MLAGAQGTVWHRQTEKLPRKLIMGFTNLCEHNIAGMNISEEGEAAYDWTW
jgi:hypothetical protein